MGRGAGFPRPGAARVAAPSVAAPPPPPNLVGAGAAPEGYLGRGAGFPIGGAAVPPGPQAGRTFPLFQGIGAPLEQGGGELPGFAAKIGMTPGFGAAQNAISSVPESLMTASSSAPKAGMSLRDMLSGAARGTQNFLKSNSEIAKLAGQGFLQQLPSAQSRAIEAEAELGQERLKLEQQKFELQKQEMERERLRRQRIAELLMPMYQQYAQQLGYNR